MHRILLLILLFFLVTLKAQAAVLPDRGLTLDQVAKFKKEIENRMNALPTDEVEIITERNWVAQELGAVRKLINDYGQPLQGESDFQNLENDLIDILSDLERLNCVSLPQAKNEIDTITSKFGAVNSKVFRSSFIDDKEWTEIGNLFKRVTRFAPSAFRPTPELTLEDCKDIVGFYKKDHRPTIRAFFSKVKEQRQKNESNRNEISISLNQLESELSKYSNALLNKLQKAKTKGSLQSNLYLMILTIGLLSIAAIGLVKLFPDDVMMEWVASGQVIQFVTVMILLSVIMALGLAGLLSENTLGTLLGGIGGYVLSQGIGRSAARRAEKAIDYKRKHNLANSADLKSSAAD